MNGNECLDIGKPFTQEEITGAVNDCCSFMAPGPDGFNFTFVKKAWKFSKQDFMDFMGSW